MEFDAEQVSTGVWELTPKGALGGGQFVLWKTHGATPGTVLAYLFDFTIDAPENPPWKK